MKEYPVFISNEAQSEVAQILQYLENTLGSPQAKNNFLDELQHQKEIIAAIPQIYGISTLPEIQAIEGRIAPINNAPINKYLMVYVFDGEKIVILHVFHALQDYGRLI